jgi:hypothetical protein
MTSAIRGHTNMALAFLSSMLGGTYLALVAFLVVTSVDWTTRGLVAFIALIPLMVLVMAVGAWQLLRGPLKWRFSRWHWLGFFGPTAALILVALYALAFGYSLS